MSDITKNALRVEVSRRLKEADRRQRQIEYLIEHEHCNHPDRCIANNPKARLKATMRAVFGNR